MRLYTFHIKYLIFCIGITLLILGCRTDLSGQYSYTIPEETQDGIATSSISETSLDTPLIFKSIDKVISGKYDEVHSLLIYKDGKLVVEEYFNGHQYKWDGPKHLGTFVQWDRETLHRIMSDTKSVTSALVGIAIDQGYIKNVNQSIFEYLPDHQHLKKDGKELITIEHLLTMTSGMEWNEWSAPYSSPENPIIGIWFSDKDPVSFILEGKLLHRPGTHYSYYGGCQIILGEIIRNASKMDMHEFSKTYLLDPLEIEDFEWSVKFENGVYEAAGGLKLTPRAMLKIGILFLNQGEWNGEQIIPKAWIEKSIIPYGNNRNIKVPGERSWRHGYTYSWWTRTFEKEEIDIFFAEGWGGQYIMIVPEVDMVVVFTGGNYTSIPPPKKMMDKYIIPAVAQK